MRPRPGARAGSGWGVPPFSVSADRARGGCRLRCRPGGLLSFPLSFVGRALSLLCPFLRLVFRFCPCFAPVLPLSVVCLCCMLCVFFGVAGRSLGAARFPGRRGGCLVASSSGSGFARCSAPFGPCSACVSVVRGLFPACPPSAPARPARPAGLGFRAVSALAVRPGGRWSVWFVPSLLAARPRRFAPPRALRPGSLSPLVGRWFWRARLLALRRRPALRSPSALVRRARGGA